MDDSKVEQQWAARGFSCGLWIDPPGKIWAEETHPVDQLVMLIEGTMEITVPGKVHTPKPEEEILVPAGVPHRVRNTGLTPNRWFYGYKSL